MSPALARRLPFLTSAAAVVVVLLVAWWNPSPLQRWEAITYDWRVRLATHVPSPAATNLGFVFMRDESIASLADGLLGSPIGLYWPRHVYGRVVDELTAQGAQAIAFDILFAQKRDDHAVTRVDGPGILEAEQFVAKLHPTQKPLRVDGALYIESDDYLAWQLHRSGRAIVAAERTVPPLPLLGTNALAWGDVSADRDPDGVLRRARPFQMYREWHPLFLKAQSEYGIQLNRATITPRKITLPRPDDEPVTVDLDAEGCFAAADFVGATLPPGMPPTARPFRDRRVWQIGIALAAIELGLDLDQAVVEPGRIRLRGPGGDRDLPLTREGTVLIDWALSESSPAIHAEPVEALLEQNLARVRGERSPTNHWHGRLVICGSTATGNDLTDRGATPLGDAALYVGQHWNLANSLLTNRFVRATPLPVELLILLILGVLTSWLTWRLRAVQAILAVLALAAAYCVLAVWAYLEWRLWLPMWLPVLGAAFFQHVCLVTYRVVFEEREKRKVRSVFAKVVSPNVVQELLRSEKIAFGGALREITVLFADVRGFTQLTDRNRADAEAHIRNHKLDTAAAAAYLDQQARETLNTVNLYLATVADVVKQHCGTLDKYIGDCVMAFWGAPTPNTQHAVEAVEAAVDAQRAIHALNLERAAENERRAISGQPPLALLNLGSGLNTGVAIVGLMGSDQHILNYTVFGREVNLASRLEGVSGRGRVIIGETTHQHLLRDDPKLAARCRPLEPTTVKGIADTLTCYEVPWQQEAPSPVAPA